MQRRPLGKTGLSLPVISLGAAGIGQEYQQVDIGQVIDTVRTAIDLGLNFIDTSPYYGRCTSEVLLGFALKGVPRESYLLGSKLGRYDARHFDFSARRVVESVDTSLVRLGVEYLDICLCHDIEFVSLQQIVEETLPALRKVQAAGKVRFVGISGYPMKIFTSVLAQTDLDVVLSYNHYTLQNTMLQDILPLLKSRGVAIMNASPFSARLLSNSELPPWHRAPAHVRACARQAAELCRERGSDIAKVALQFASSHPDLATCIAGAERPELIREWVRWMAEPVDQTLLNDVLKVLQPIHNWFYVEGLAENNDPLPR